MNNGHYHKTEYKDKLRTAMEKHHGIMETHTLTCMMCEQEFEWEGRKNTKTYQRKIEKCYCSRSCANKVGAKKLNEQRGYSNYRTIAFKHYDKECIVCGFDKIVAVHHINHNHSDNRPENLVPLCPNHHEMLHSNEYGAEMETSLTRLLEGRGDS